MQAFNNFDTDNTSVPHLERVRNGAHWDQRVPRPHMIVNIIKDE